MRPCNVIMWKWLKMKAEDKKKAIKAFKVRKHQKEKFDKVI